MTRPATTRRDFLQLTGSAVGGAWLSMHLPAIQAAGLYAREAVLVGGQAFETLESAEARILEAIAARFFPTDGTPGATEAGVVYFMDRSMGSFFGWMLPPVREVLAAQQDELMGWLEAEQPQSFFLLQILAACGMFGDPAQGGNRDGVGWELIGFESAAAWDPPFGHYDRQYMESGRDGPGEPAPDDRSQSADQGARAFPEAVGSGSGGERRSAGEESER
jgi:gluconate 2-dehydrogenase gamma chain